jgi:hypothetical protein
MPKVMQEAMMERQEPRLMMPHAEEEEPKKLPEVATNLPVPQEYDFVALQRQVTDAMMAAAKQSLDEAQRDYDRIKETAEEMMAAVTTVALDLKDKKERQLEFGKSILDAAAKCNGK